jgi:Domain of unknown function (DUF4440)
MVLNFILKVQSNIMNIKSSNLFLLPLALFLMTSFSGNKKRITESAPEKQSNISQELYSAIAHMDSVMFDAFNNHDLDKLKTTFSENLEFYHDKGGLSNYQQTMENFKTLFEKNKSTGLRRDIVPGSLEVYPIKDIGAVETCLHKFCHIENGKEDCGTFKNIMIWQNKDGHWKVTRVISYDH